VIAGRGGRSVEPMTAPRAIELEVDTFRSPRQFGPAARLFVERMLSEVVEPVLRDESDAGLRWPTADPNAFIDFRTHSWSVTGFFRGGRRIPGPLTEPDWLDLLEQVGAGSVSTLQVVVHRPHGLIEGARAMLARLSIDDLRPSRTSAHSVSASISPRLDGDTRPARLQETLAGLFRSLGEEVEAATGALTFDIFPFAHEQAIGRFADQGLDDCDRYLRGYAWANLLSDQHLAALGGRKTVLAHAPVAHAADLSRDGHELVYLQLSESIESFTDEQLRRLKAFLELVLIPLDPRRPSRRGASGRVV
jgi:hypothetical protein